MSLNAVKVKYWNEIAEERQMAHVIQTDPMAIDIHSLNEDLGDSNRKYVGRTWMNDIERAAETGEALVIPSLPGSDKPMIDGETAKNLLGAILRKLEQKKLA